MSSSKIPKNESSSQFLLSELVDSSSSEDEEAEIESRESDATNQTLSASDASKVFLSASGENVEKSTSHDTADDYERKTILKIMDIKEVVEQLEQQIVDFNREQLREQSKKFEEILIQNTLALDNTDTKNLESVRELRKNTIIYIQDCLKLLDSKLNK